MRESYDLAVVGAGILGQACALAAARSGKKVIVIDRDAQANGASVRNFGFITVTGQQRGDCWRRAMRSRDVWDEVAAPAGIDIVHEGLLVVARRPEAARVLEAFSRSETGAGCRLHEGAAAARLQPGLLGNFEAVLESPHERRVESRDALPRLAAWLERAHGVAFMRNTAALGVMPGSVATSRGDVSAGAVVVCAGDDFHTLFAERIAPYRLTRCKLQMMRARSNVKFSRAIMTDLSLVRYLGYAELAEAAALRRRLDREQSAHLAAGVHLIVVGAADGSMVIGDSHVYADTPDPFASEAFDELILDEYEALFGGRPAIQERWMGTYASADDRLMLVDAPYPNVRIAIVTSGTGASTAFAIGEEIIADLLG
ncbi:TIGR03364 family FAD-dependent oxidoreductase [Methylocapsa sp. S129]|uniref:TIGR03364 family FAD-dependent oxidoreductase n=1 Tax=Methylocapsa sp. S129 TaxID=1641869 RepID=UPI00131E69F8|nr:TIGR03364 family FAD-dependent oxidoreductase [Methylocapsa sp. S129]